MPMEWTTPKITNPGLKTKRQALHFISGNKTVDGLAIPCACVKCGQCIDMQTNLFAYGSRVDTPWDFEWFQTEGIKRFSRLYL